MDSPAALSSTPCFNRSYTLPAHTLRKRLEDRRTKPRLRKKNIRARFDRLAIPSQQQRRPADKIDQLLSLSDLVLQRKRPHDRGNRFLLIGLVIHLQIDIGHAIAPPAAQEA